MRGYVVTWLPSASDVLEDNLSKSSEFRRGRACVRNTVTLLSYYTDTHRSARASV